MYIDFIVPTYLISFDPSNSSKPFEVTGLLSGKEPPQICDYSR
jgi:hypothetical protein